MQGEVREREMGGGSMKRRKAPDERKRERHTAGGVEMRDGG